MDEEATVPKKEANTFFKLIRSQSNNKSCADCAKPSPIWASVTFGFFICAECAAKHRELGVQISKVKSTMLDTWEIGELRRMCVSGNAHAPKLGKDSDLRAKYAGGRWYAEAVDKAAARSAAEEPGTAFMHNLEKRLRKSVEPQKVRERPMPKFGDKEVRSEPPRRQPEGAREEQKRDAERAVAIKQNLFPSLRKARGFRIEEDGDTSKRLGLGAAGASSESLDSSSLQNKDL
jgi:ADP-ribosylation factor GTPase-activating protein 2/3